MTFQSQKNKHYTNRQGDKYKDKFYERGTEDENIQRVTGGVYDPNIFKASFLQAGVVVVSLMWLRELQKCLVCVSLIDDVFEQLIKKGMNMDMRNYSGRP